MFVILRRWWCWTPCCHLTVKF